MSQAILLREIIEPISINREWLCSNCGARYRGERDVGCPCCLGGDPERLEPEAHYRGPLGSREEQRKVMEQVRQDYRELMGRGIKESLVVRHISQSMKLKLDRVQGIIRRARKEGLL